MCARDPGFDLPSFLRGIRDQVRVFEKANAEGDVDTLRKMCSEELVGRLSERFKALRCGPQS